MGMSDRQFDAFLKSHLGRLETAKKELQEKGITSKELDKVIQEIDEQLKRP
jgi:fructosamine-3-kinase